MEIINKIYLGDIIYYGTVADICRMDKLLIMFSILESKDNKFIKCQIFRQMFTIHDAMKNKYVYTMLPFKFTKLHFIYFNIPKRIDIYHHHNTIPNNYLKIYLILSKNPLLYGLTNNTKYDMIFKYNE